ncbi:MAG: glycoside hydrolase family 13 protein, partial [Actinobacteria bacterium]|nr:glycoside hydrolase family 13 protein [Actinomycetota bacterium]
MASLHPHHDGSALYVSDQAPAPGAVVSVRLTVPHTAGVSGVHVRTVPDGEQTFVDARLVHRDDLQGWW